MTAYRSKVLYLQCLLSAKKYIGINHGFTEFISQAPAEFLWIVLAENLLPRPAAITSECAQKFMYWDVNKDVESLALTKVPRLSNHISLTKFHEILVLLSTCLWVGRGL